MMLIVAETLFQELRTNGDATKQELYRMCSENDRGSHLLMFTSASIGSPTLLDRVQERPDVEGNLRQLRRQRLKERGSAVYIPAQAKAGLQASDEARFALMERVEEFMDSNQAVFLLLGDSGAGKSTFNRELECTLWQKYKKKTGTIPLHINLPSIDKPEHDMISKQLRKAEFTESQILELKFHRKFILICDGYDESQQSHNLYTRNRLNEAGEWQAKMVISCRSEYLGIDYRDRFQPGDRNHRSEVSLFHEAVMTPFSLNQVQNYIDQYVSVHRPLWEADQYKKALELIPSLKELVKNPFLMSLSLEVLPRMMDPGQNFSTTHITRVELYDQFVEHWLERGKKRLGEKNLSSQARAAFENLTGEGFIQNGVHFLKNLCAAIYRNQGGQPIVGYSRYKDEESWKTEFFGREEEKQLLREACPLIRNGSQYRFIHRSLLDYGVALAIFDPQELKERKAPQPSLARQMSTISVMSSDEQDFPEETPVVTEQEPEFSSPLAWRSFVKDLSVLQFLEERVQKEPIFKQLLLNYINQSKNDKKWRIAASNAITILVRAGVQFKNADLRGIRVPFADLSYGMFDSAQFQGADLRHVDFRGAWLRQANLSDAQMTSAQFGELPLLQQDDSVIMCVYSPDGTTIAAGLDNYNISVSSTLSCAVLWTLEGHYDILTTITYSPDSSLIASGSRDCTIRLWDVQTGTCIHDLEGHDHWVWSVAYSPQGDQVVSASFDLTVKVWDVETGDCCYILVGHTEDVLGAIYSPQGNQIASSSYDRTVRLWDIEKETCIHVLCGHNEPVWCIAYSPQGDQIVSGSMDDSAIRLWDVATGDCRHVLRGHTGSVNSVVYSPNGDQVASCSSDNSIRLWDVKTGVCVHTLLGHTSPVASVVYSPQGDLVASASYDKAVQLWDTETGVCRQTLTGHSSIVTSAIFSPKGDRVASSSGDRTVRLWEVGVGISRHTFNGHTDSIRKIKFSPQGDCVATCSDDRTVRIWDIKTGACRHTLRGHPGVVYCIAYSPQGHQLATGDEIVRLWNTKTGECSHTLALRRRSRNRGRISDIVYSPCGDQLASAGHYGVQLWDIQSGQCRHTLTCSGVRVKGVMYSPDGSQVVSYNEGFTVQIWDAETGVCNRTLTGHDDRVNGVVYSPRGDKVVSASSDTTVRVWDVATGACRRIFGHNDWVSFVAYSPRGDQIASGDMDGFLKIWDLKARTCRWTLSGHSEKINKIVYSSRGDLIVSTSNDKSVRLWDVASGQCRAKIQGFQDKFNDIAWIETFNINYLATGCSDGTVGLWKVENHEDRCAVSLQWTTMRGALNVVDATIQNVQGLSQLNKQLLQQRGAVGEPAHLLREASKKLATMASVVSHLKTSDKMEEDPASKTNHWAEQLEQWLEQGKGLLQQDVVASVSKAIRKHK